MGCGASTFPRDESGGGGGGGISYLYVNPLHRHSPWRCKGTRSASDGNPSSKKLLVEATVDEDGGDSVGRRSVSVDPVSPENNGDFMKEPPVQTMIENVPDLKREVMEEGPMGGDRDYDDDGNDERLGAGEDDKSHADEGSDNEQYGLLFPRSPSFRYYCMPRDDDDDSSSSSSLDGMKARIDIGETDEVLTRVESNKTSKDHDNAGNASPAKLSSNETLSSSKKSRKSAARRLRVALSKRNPGTGMKNMLSVTSCSPRRAPQVAS